MRKKLCEEKSVKNPISQCWEWKGSISEKGYGTLRYEGKNYMAHRFAYETYNGELISDMIICHKCNNPKCINPDHLYQGTIRDNARDMAIKNLVGHSGLIKLREYMHENDMTIQDLADKIGKSRHHTQLLVNGKTNPGIQIAHKIEQMTGGKVKVHEIRKCKKDCQPGCACSKGV